MIKVAIVVGHRSGAKGAWGNAGISEFDFNSAIAKELKKTFANNKKIDLEVFYRDNMPGGYGEKMKRLHKRIDNWGANYSISLHFNAAGRKDVDGHEVLYCSNRGKEVALKFNTLFSKYLKNRDRGVKRRVKSQRGGGFLCRGRSIAIIAEPFFAAHQKKFIKGADGGDKLLLAYKDFLKWLGEENA